MQRPSGIFQALIDSRGRLRLPATIRLYWSELGLTRFAVNSFDVRRLRIDPVTESSATSDPVLDRLGRLQLPSKLIDLVGAIPRPVYAYFSGDHLTIAPGLSVEGGRLR